MKRNKNVKQWGSILLALVMVIAGVLQCTPVNAEAASYAYEDKIKYESVSNAVALYNSNKAPTKPGYVFGGWFDAAQEGATQITKASVTSSDTLYAKFVPAYVLSVRAQNQENPDGTMNVRLISGVDSDAHYKAVGFEVYLGNKVVNYRQAGGTYVYGKIAADEKEYWPTDLFGTKASYFNVVQLSNINEVNFNSIVYARPYWVTNDGTTVYGLPKYVCVNDGVEDIISIPVNLSTAKKIAVGVVQISYPDTLDYVGYHYEGTSNRNRMFGQMKVLANETEGIVRCVGSATDNENHQANEDIYVSLKFKIRDADTQLGDERYNIKIDSVDFCDWSENDVSMSDFVWDIQY